MKRTNFLFMLTLALICSATTASAQYEKLCVQIEHSITRELKTAQIYRNDPASYGCNIEWSLPDLSIDIDNYDSDESSATHFTSTERYFRTVRVDEKLKPKINLSRYKIWDEATLIPPHDRSGSYVTVLRCKKFVITLVSPDKQLLINVEKLIRPLFMDT